MAELKHTSVRLHPSTERELEDLRDDLDDQSELAKAGQMTRAFVHRLALERGLEAVRDEYLDDQS